MERLALERVERWEGNSLDEISLDLATDSEWLSRLAGYDVDQDTIGYANELIAGEYTALHSEHFTDDDIYATDAQIHEKRRRFYEEILFWADERHEFHDHYQNMLDQRPALDPLADFVIYHRGSGKEPMGFFNYEVIRTPQLPSNGEDDYITVRYKNLTAWGLDAEEIVSAEKSILNSTTGMINAKILTIRAILRYVGSRNSAQSVVNGRPNLLVSSSVKMRSLVRMLAGSVDPVYIKNLDAKRLGQFITPPIDSVLAAVAEKKISDEFAPGGIRRQDIVEIQKRFFTKKDRREHSLQILSDPVICEKIGGKVIRAYLDYAPLKPAELTAYPALSRFVGTPVRTARRI